jgi:hypothetical protein
VCSDKIGIEVRPSLQPFVTEDCGILQLTLNVILMRENYRGKKDVVESLLWDRAGQVIANTVQRVRMVTCYTRTPKKGGLQPEVWM